MPVLTQTVPQSQGFVQAAFLTIGDLANEVIIKCENRASDLARSYNWVRDALIEISSNPELRGEFDALEDVGPAFVLTPDLQEYNFTSNLVNVGDTNLAGLDVLIWRDPPTNKRRRKLRQTHYQHADSIELSSSMEPQFWYRFSDNIGFVPVPNKAFQVQARIYKFHPINDLDLKATGILLPREWYEFITLAALERGWIELEEYEKATSLHQLLYGDPKNPSQGGLFKSIKHRRQLESWRQEQPLTPVVSSGYGYRGR
jgi:hypothetical protein